MASVEVESATNTLLEKVESTQEVQNEVEPVVDIPPAPEPEVEEPTKEPLAVDAPTQVEDPPISLDPIEIKSKVVEEPKTDVVEVKVETTQEEVKEIEATTDAVVEKTSATTEAVEEKTPTKVIEEAKKPEEDEKPAEVVATEVAKEE